MPTDTIIKDTVYSGPRIVEVSNQELNGFAKKAGILTGESYAPMNDIDLEPIFKAFRSGQIGIDEKNQLLMRIIRQQVRINNSNGINTRFLNSIKFPGWTAGCNHCGGKGFTVILRSQIHTEPCRGIPSRGILPCDNTGIKTSVCNRCGGLTLREILTTREFLLGTPFETLSEEDQAVYGPFRHFSEIKVSVLPDKFIQKNLHLTFRVIKSDYDKSDKPKNAPDDEKYTYIQKTPCSACNGTGKFIHDKKGIKCPTCGGHDDNCETCNGEGTIDGKPIPCPSCGGKKHSSRKFITLPEIEAFAPCDHCGGKGMSHLNPVINVKTMTSEVKYALEQSGLLK